MRRIMIRAIGAARHNHANGRRFGQHGADLHRRCMRAQHRSAPINCGHVKRIMILPRGMVIWDIERAEIMPIAFDIGAFRHLEAHGAEQRGQFFHGARNGVNPAFRCGARRERARRQGYIHAFRRQARIQGAGFHHGALCIQSGFDCGFHLVQRGTTFLACFGGDSAKALQQRGQRAGFAQHGDAHGIQGAGICGGANGGLGFGLQGSQVVGHVILSEYAKGRIPRNS